MKIDNLENKFAIDFHQLHPLKPAIQLPKTMAHTMFSR